MVELTEVEKIVVDMKKRKRKPASYRDIGNVLKVSRQRVEQIHKKALRKLAKIKKK